MELKKKTVGGQNIYYLTKQNNTKASTHLYEILFLENKRKEYFHYGRKFMTLLH